MTIVQLECNIYLKLREYRSPAICAKMQFSTVSFSSLIYYI